ncbi:MAG: Re/Si-specific NAD(P)(+) transhydrogenase subunit alpha [Myxococcota bacterium]
MIIGVPREIANGEKRVALAPDSVRKLVDTGLEVLVQCGAGSASGHDDDAYQAAGAALESDPAELFERADVLVRVQPFTKHPETGRHEVEMLRRGSCLIGVLQPFANLDVIRQLAERRVTSFSLDLMPRITRAQSMDVLSAMSTLTGYKAVLIAASALTKLFPMMMTAAGTLKPARVLVLGAGVAGLQAIATARRLGAVVEAFDIRPAVKEQVESLGARFVEEEALAQDAEDAGGYAKAQTAEQLEKQRRMLAQHMAESDVVICTALVPGRRAPILMTEAQVKGMHPGSLVVDLAAEQGGNCELTEPGQVVDVDGVQIHGPLNLASSLCVHATQMFSRNLMNFLLHLTTEGRLKVELEDELTRGPLVTHEGAIVHEAVRAATEE